MNKIDPRTLEILQKYHDEPKEAVWQHAQSGQWLIKHKDIEHICARAGIIFDQPVALQASAADGVALVVQGRFDQQRLKELGLPANSHEEWSIGEASPSNLNPKGPKYPYAMAEKRAKDRVALKLLQLHGSLYSEDEMPENSEEKPAPEPSEKVVKALAFAKKFVADLNELAESELPLTSYMDDNESKITAAAKYPEARKVLEDAGVKIN